MRPAFLTGFCSSLESAELEPQSGPEAGGRAAGAGSRRDWRRRRLETFAEVAAPPGSANSGLTITLRVYNYARVPRAILIAAERETAAIFRKAGVETEWMDCQLSRAEPHRPACDKPFSDLDLILRILPSSMARAFAPYEDTFGMALAGEGRPSTTAVILYGQVPDLARTRYADEQDILAAVMAHEIGHLLLGGAHSATGIMRAKWNREEVKLAGRGQLQFTPEQSLLIRNEVAARLERADGRSQ